MQIVQFKFKGVIGVCTVGKISNYVVNLKKLLFKYYLIIIKKEFSEDNTAQNQGLRSHIQAGAKIRSHICGT